MPAARPTPGVFRVRYMTTETVPHVYCHVYAAPAPNLTFASLGLLTLRKAEFAAFRLAFKAEFVDDLRPDEPEDDVRGADDALGGL